MKTPRTVKTKNNSKNLSKGKRQVLPAPLRCKAARWCDLAVVTFLSFVVRNILDLRRLPNFPFIIKSTFGKSHIPSKIFYKYYYSVEGKRRKKYITLIWDSRLNVYFYLFSGSIA